jgi:hypothetical protein
MNAFEGSRAETVTRREALLKGARATALAGLAGALGPLVDAGQVRAKGSPGAPGAGRAELATTGAGVSSYLAFMDYVAERLQDDWSPAHDAYRPFSDVYSTPTNAHMLQVHAVAASVGHTGPSRNDARALALVETLLSAPAPWRTSGNAYTRQDKMFHIPGWTESLTNPEAAMDKAVDPQVAEALTAAWRASATIGMSAVTSARLVEEVSSCAHNSFFRYPGIRLNQLNWNSALYALASELTGYTDLLRQDYREQLMRFTRYATRPERKGGSPNLGPGWHFDYLPNRSSQWAFNLDSAEYANETIDAVRHYRQALAAGMEPLPPGALGVLRAYAERTLYGDWTHAGYLNWDTGLGYRRRYIGKVFALAQQGLLAVAISPDVQHTPEMGANAHWLFDRGLELYRRWATESPNGLAPAVQFGQPFHPESPDSQTLFAARIAGNAAQAISLGLEAVPSAEPPSMYSFDPDSQRLAISTRSYSTAILVHARGAVDYEGIDLCRLFDSEQRPVGCTGGDGLANFLARVNGRGARELVSTQMGGDATMSVAAVQAGGHTRLAGPGSPPYPARAYAGPMRSVRASGVVSRGGASIRTNHDFTPGHIDLDWEMDVPAGGSWEVALPSYGPEAEIVVRRRAAAGETPLHLASTAVSLASVGEIVVRCAAGFYVIAPLGLRPVAKLRVARLESNQGAARPGPTLLISGRKSRGGAVRLSLRLRVA